MLDSILFVLLKCFLYWIGVKMSAHIVLSFVSTYEKLEDTVSAVLAIVFFLVLVGLFFYGVYDVITDVATIGGAL